MPGRSGRSVWPVRAADGHPPPAQLDEELQQRRQLQQSIKDEGKKAGTAITGFNFKEGIASVATAGEIGDYYQYVIDQKISVARQKSAISSACRPPPAGGGTFLSQPMCEAKVF